uniref:Uncharacterized protein n=1 Tax=Plectus sambesii TaxID=2011161 RepID=A0A914VE60_9BILA
MAPSLASGGGGERSWMHPAREGENRYRLGEHPHCHRPDGAATSPAVQSGAERKLPDICRSRFCQTVSQPPFSLSVCRLSHSAVVLDCAERSAAAAVDYLRVTSCTSSGNRRDFQPPLSVTIIANDA